MFADLPADERAGQTSVCLKQLSKERSVLWMIEMPF
jgi:hypothetical protein